MLLRLSKCAALLDKEALLGAGLKLMGGLGGFALKNPMAALGAGVAGHTAYTTGKTISQTGKQLQGYTQAVRQTPQFPQSYQYFA